jgi:hypothetical protein
MHILSGRATPRLRRASPGRMVLAVTVGGLVAVMLSIGNGSAAAAQTCKSIAIPGAKMQVSVRSGHVRCGRARRVLSDFWRGTGEYHARRPYQRSYTIVDGWTCRIVRAGLSRCTRRHRLIVGAYPLGKVPGQL